MEKVLWAQPIREAVGRLRDGEEVLEKSPERSRTRKRRSKSKRRKEDFHSSLYKCTANGAKSLGKESP